MTTPTQAQIEADNQRLRSALADMVEITKRNSSPEIILTAIRTCATHALTAAAQVGEPPVRVWVTQRYNDDGTAQVGEPVDTADRYIKTQDWIEKRKAIRQSAIERCAQVVDKMVADLEALPQDQINRVLIDALRQATVAIRKLKNDAA